LFKKSPAKYSLFLLLSLLATGKLYAKENPFVKPFPFKEGVITYITKGNQSGSSALYFRNYGKEQLMVENLSGTILDNPKNASRITLIKSDGKYIIDHKSDHADKVPLLTEALYKKFQKLTKREQEIILENLKKSSDRALEAIATPCTSMAKKIIGIDCTQEYIDGITTCTTSRGGLVLEKSVSLLGYHTYTFATKFQARKVDPKFFQLPEGLKVDEQDGDIDQKAQKVINTLLKHPDLCQTPKKAEDEELHRFMFEEIQNLSKQF
jgi:hypothetical protein